MAIHKYLKLNDAKVNKLKTCLRTRSPFKIELLFFTFTNMYNMYFLIYSFLAVCEFDSYKDVYGNEPCFPCLPNHVTQSKGSTSHNDCTCTKSTEAECAGKDSSLLP